MAGRRTKASDERLTALLNALRAGNTRSAACAFAEISRQTFYRWIEEDATFSDSVEKAEADAEVRYVAQVAKAATNGTWQAAAWWLERRRQEAFALHSKVEMTGKDGGPIATKDLTDAFSDHETREIVRAAQEYLAGAGSTEGPSLAEGPAVGEHRPEKPASA